MAYSVSVKNKAVSLRERGFSLNEIHLATGITKSTLSVWLRNVFLSEMAQKRLKKKIRAAVFASAEKKRRETRKLIDSYLEKYINDVNQLRLNIKLARLLCALIYWCEGIKNDHSSLIFTNSDPRLVKAFLSLFRKSFNLSEKKFRVCVHLHKYHNPKVILSLWSKITDIPLNQFTQPFLKMNVQKRIHEDYKGCASIRYHDVSIHRELLGLAGAFLKSYGSMN